MDTTTVDALLTLLAGLLLAVGVAGTIFPILPGSVLTIVTLLSWAWLLGSTASWTAGLAGVAFALIGMSASLVLTGRKMRKERIPNGPVLIGVLFGVVGMFLIPVVGLFVGFALGLLVAELVRRRDLPAAARASWEALKSMGAGMALEFLFASLAATAFVLGAFAHFA
ncbi:DUF456 domain-containing protein [Corynebacterium guangdongense]|uniref:Uncharacterized protein YqgC (DUF456 family) n=1 Tax=Corynebacterium guangdongense TaxID=1783348 RepID=A0ABU1ZZE6_9CORY|nr:DUF456 domain-containing protein [Corynebacterium guangdongense]MDR7330299.1 uncharacterized protein YqgC (DUF456 family) [Corynebacterium guangdongense]WJZ18857.1 hypothetical protein CGUA_11605 [Corynebacterium guangdongense]